MDIASPLDRSALSPLPPMEHFAPPALLAARRPRRGQPAAVAFAVVFAAPTRSCYPTG